MAVFPVTAYPIVDGLQEVMTPQGVHLWGRARTHMAIETGPNPLSNWVLTYQGDSDDMAVVLDFYHQVRGILPFWFYAPEVQSNVIDCGVGDGSTSQFNAGMIEFDNLRTHTLLVAGVATSYYSTSYSIDETGQLLITFDVGHTPTTGQSIVFTGFGRRLYFAVFDGSPTIRETIDCRLYRVTCNIAEVAAEVAA